MPIIIRNDEQIKVGTTTGLVAGSTSFVFDGTSGKPDYKDYQIVITEIGGRGVMVVGLDYSWNPSSATFQLLQVGDVFQVEQWYNIHFQPIQQSIIVSPSNIIDVSFFVRDINLPNTSSTPIIEKINLFIFKHEPECLENLLGYSLYNLFLNETSQRMTDLLYGAEYTDIYGKVKKWKGIVHDTNISLIAYYVYYFIQKSAASHTTGVSETTAASEAGTSISSAEKMVSAWNSYCNEANNMIYFLWCKNSDYPEFDYTQYCASLQKTKKINVFGI